MNRTQCSKEKSTGDRFRGSHSPLCPPTENRVSLKGVYIKYNNDKRTRFAINKTKIIFEFGVLNL